MTFFSLSILIVFENVFWNIVDKRNELTEYADSAP